MGSGSCDPVIPVTGVRVSLTSLLTAMSTTGVDQVQTGEFMAGIGIAPVGRAMSVLKGARIW